MERIRIKEVFSKVLKRLTLNINAYEKDPDLGYLESIAQDLRSSLCDHKYPYLIKYAEKINYPLYIYHGIPDIDDKNPETVFSANFTPIGTKFMTSGTNYSLIGDFLNKVTFRTPSDTGDPRNYLTYKNLIKRVCNKDGISHFEEFEKDISKNYSFIKGITFTSNDLELKNAFIRPIVLNLGKWVQVVINFLLSMMDIRDELQQKYESLSNYELLEPDYFPCVFDVVPYLTANLYLEGNCCVSNDLKKIVPIKEGISFLSLCKILPQIHTGKRILFEFQNENNKSFFKVELDSDLTMELDGEEIILINNFKDSQYFNSFCAYTFNLHSKYFEFYIDGKLIKSISVNLDKYQIKRISSAGGLNCKNAISCLLAEFSLVQSFLADSVIAMISKTFYKRLYDFTVNNGI